jgi:uncharacterized membrane protein YozB (DUF420 family)
MNGFLNTWAPFSSDLNLVLQLGMGFALLAGTYLARVKRFRAHGICQAAVLVINLFSIALVMWPSFHHQVLPRLPARLARRNYAFATAHGLLGVAVELFGIYILLAAGTDVLPASWRFQRWNFWMRVELALWWVVLLLGAALYIFWYVRPR